MLATTILGIGATRVHREFGYRTLLGSDYQPIAEMETFVERYGGGFPVYIVWRCGDNSPCASVFDEVSVRMASALEAELLPTPGVRDVLSPASASLLVPAVDGFSVRRLLADDDLASDIEALSARALEDPLWVGNLVSEKGDVAAIVVMLSDAKSETMEGVIDSIQSALVRFRSQGFEFHLAGHPVASVVAGRDLAESTETLVPYIAMVIAVVVLGLTRSWKETLVVMVTMGVGLLWTLGFLGWLEWPQDSVLQVLAPLILVVGVCDAVHLLASYNREADGAESLEARVLAIRMAAQQVGSACLMTTMTTAVAFLSFLTSDLDTFVRFGATCAFGVVSCLLLTFSMLPLLVLWLAPLPPRRRPGENAVWDRVARGVVGASRRRRTSILVSAVAVCLICAFGWARYLSVDTQPEEMFGEQSRVTQWDRFVVANLRGSDSLELDVTLLDGENLASPETQEALSDFMLFLESTDGLGRAVSVKNLVARLNRVLHDDDERFETFAQSIEGNAEILEVLSLDDRDMLEAWVTPDASQFRISAEGVATTSLERGRTLDEVRAYVERVLPRTWVVSLTGPFALSYDWVHELQATQLRSFATAFLLVLALMAGFLGSFWLGLAAMVPAVIPVVLTLGLMGFAGMSLDVGRVMIAAIVIGIGVDDSIHLLSRYRMELRCGHPSDVAMRDALVSVVKPLVVTSVALSLGFLTLTTSAWQTLSSFGFLVSLSIFAALVSTLFVLPAIFLVGGSSDGA